MFNFTTLPPLSLYIHLPWCARKCPYCDFNSHEQRDALPERDYTQALLRDLEHDLPRIWGRRIVSIFIGGGTPSLFSPEAVNELLSGVRARVNLLPDAEITLEANPGSSEYAKFAEFRAAGVNRLSIGIQSFNDDHLRALGRIHGRREAIAAAEAAHYAGFDNFNLDLMYALPGQNTEQALADLNTAVALEPAHISHYQLTIEPNTFFHSHPPVLPDDDAAWTMQEHCQQRLAERGYQHYEISAYAQAGRRCKHNLNYWEFGDYLGIGAGAHGKITDAQQQSITRLWKIKQPRAYMDGVAAAKHVGGEQQLTPYDALLEFMMNALRLSEGFSLESFAAHTGLPLAWVEAPLRDAVARGLIEWSGSHVRPTPHGARLLNDLLQLFMMDDAAASQRHTA
ncbi:MAG: radical SAM family heme chaperone HemW [Pseudomonadota bacterium]